MHKRMYSWAVATVVGVTLSVAGLTTLHADCAFIDRFEQFDLELLDVAINGESVELPIEAEGQEFLVWNNMNRSTSDSFREDLSMVLFDRETGETKSVDVQAYEEELPDHLEPYLGEGEGQ